MRSLDLTLFDVGLDLAPGRHRRDDHATSVEGARGVAVRAGSQKAALLRAYALASGPMTDEEAADAAGLPSRSCFWKRCSELRDLGLIEVAEGADGPLRDLSNLTGHWRFLCRITPAGLDAWRGLE